ncbi:OB-fold domain-containing protein [Candidatus Roizmanbacteria bacterium]|nr:OB-fold domain-containing protein [Candidatus Roizmanbacteria bacterium]
MISPVKIWRRQKEIRSILGKKGKILTWSIIYAAGPEFKKFAPYPIVIVELENHQKATAQLVDYDKDDLKIGRKVVAILRKVREGGAEDVLVYGIKFKPT